MKRPSGKPELRLDGSLATLRHRLPLSPSNRSDGGHPGSPMIRYQELPPSPRIGLMPPQGPGAEQKLAAEAVKDAEAAEAVVIDVDPDLEDSTVPPLVSDSYQPPPPISTVARYQPGAQSKKFKFFLGALGVVFATPYVAIGGKFNSQHPEFFFTPVIAAAICNMPFVLAFEKCDRAYRATLCRKPFKAGGSLILGTISAAIISRTLIEDIETIPPALLWASFFPIRAMLHSIWLFDSMQSAALSPQTNKKFLDFAICFSLFVVALPMNAPALIVAASEMKVVTGQPTWDTQQGPKPNIIKHPGPTIAGIFFIAPILILTLMSWLRIGKKCVAFCKTTDPGSAPPTTSYKKCIRYSISFSVLAVGGLSGTISYQNAKDEVPNLYLVILIALNAAICNLFYLFALVDKFDQASIGNKKDTPSFARYRKDSGGEGDDVFAEIEGDDTDVQPLNRAARAEFSL